MAEQRTHSQYILDELDRVTAEAMLLRERVEALGTALREVADTWLPDRICDCNHCQAVEAARKLLEEKGSE